MALNFTPNQTTNKLGLSSTSYGPGKRTSEGYYTGSGTMGQSGTGWNAPNNGKPTPVNSYRGPSQEEMQQRAKAQAEAESRQKAQADATSDFKNTEYDTSSLTGTVSQNMDTLSEQFDNAYNRYIKALEAEESVFFGKDLAAANAATKYNTAKEDFQKKYVDEAIQGALDSSNDRADAYTNKTAIQAASDTNNKYESVGRAESAQMSTNDDAYQAAAYKEQNLQQNRTNTLQDTINEGQAVLKGLGMETDAAGIAEAQKLLDESKSQMRWSDTFETLLPLFKGALDANGIIGANK